MNQVASFNQLYVPELPAKMLIIHSFALNHQHNAQYQHSKGWRRLTFVAMGNRSQAKEEKGEKTHSGHLREEGGKGQREISCINLI